MIMVAIVFEKLFSEVQFASFHENLILEMAFPWVGCSDIDPIGQEGNNMMSSMPIWLMMFESVSNKVTQSMQTCDKTPCIHIAGIKAICQKLEV